MCLGGVYAVFLNLNYLHARAAYLRYGAGKPYGTAWVSRHPLFDLRQVADEARRAACYLGGTRLYASRKLLDLYLPSLGSHALDLVEVQCGLADPSAIDVAIAYDVASFMQPYPVVLAVHLGVQQSSFRHVATRLNGANVRVALLDLTSGFAPHSGGAAETHLVSEYIWRQPADLPDDSSCMFDTLEDGAFETTPLMK